MSTKEAAVRTAATNLHDAIATARKAGLRVDWPATVEGLTAIQISETDKVEHDAPAKAEPAAKK